MSGLTLTLRAPLADRVDAAGLLAPGWQTADATTLARRTLHAAREGAVAAGDLFAVAGTPGPVVMLEGDLARIDRLAEGLDGGTVVVRGSVGDRLAAAIPGAKRGMSAGEVVVHGDAGAEAGACLRRGVVVVTGACGPGAGRAMLAGTIVVGGRVGPDSGRWSKRGSLVCLGDATIPATYAYACTYQPVWLRVLLVHLRRTHAVAIAPALLEGAWRRWVGDVAEGARGEILQASDTFTDPGVA